MNEWRKIEPNSISWNCIPVNHCYGLLKENIRWSVFLKHSVHTTTTRKPFYIWTSMYFPLYALLCPFFSSTSTFCPHEKIATEFWENTISTKTTCFLQEIDLINDTYTGKKCCYVTDTYCIHCAACCHQFFCSRTTQTKKWYFFLVAILNKTSVLNPTWWCV